MAYSEREQGGHPTGHRQIRDVMTHDPVCCVPADSAQHAARVMRDKDTGIVPVINNEQNRKLIGVVTDRDLCVALIADGHDGQAAVEEFMTSRTVSCRPDDSTEMALDLMEENQVRRILVVDGDNRVQGIVSMADLMRRSDVDDEQTHEMLERISEPTGVSSKPRAAGGVKRVS